MILQECKNKEKIYPDNPLLNAFDTPFGVPPFEKVMAKHYMPAFEYAMSSGKKDIEAIVNNNEPPTFENSIGALDKAGTLLRNIRSLFFAQADANTSDSIQEIEMEISPRLAEYDDEILLNAGLFRRIRHVYDNRETSQLKPEQLFILENLYQEYLRNGATLNPESQDSLKKINQALAGLKVKYEQNVLAETNNYRLWVDRKDIEGLPESLVASAAEVAKASGQEGKWAFTTQRPSIFPFLQYCRNRNLRSEIFNAYINRCNNGNEFDNNKILAEIVKLRAARASLLGYRSHSDVVLEPRMAKKPENVFRLLDTLWSKALPVAKKEATGLQGMIDAEGGGFKLEPHDWWYYAEKLRKRQYDLDDNELRPYFKLENVRDGLFTLANRLFGIKVSPLPGCPLPHPDAEAYEVKDTDNTHIGVLYMDFFSRESKKQGAWCITYRNRCVADGAVVTPVVSTAFNFTPPGVDLPSLLSLEEVSTIYHEFGHALDALFNRNTYNQTFTAWDFVELPSQLMEHWATEPEVLDMYARHYITGEPIPARLVEKIRNSTRFNQGFENTEVYAASLLDMAYHTLRAPVNIDIQSFEKEYFNRIGLIPEMVSRYRSTYFTHITGEYDSGYYSYTWASVIDNDAFEAFRENGLFDRRTAESYRRNILANNGIMDAMKMYVSFRGREPDIRPLLRNKGLE
jgi:peptidyl-dipeptidase Dcp